MPTAMMIQAHSVNHLLHLLDSDERADRKTQQAFNKKVELNEKQHHQSCNAYVSPKQIACYIRSMHH